ncbi:tetrahydromethanopterin S-methyltransferase subunit MtrC [Methermicoccus shengliensis]|uniref:Tetrahydromethanopterin S-methyltransferase subunit C n=1 Tax=Methermicoccus shengliensis TaxID=660064 RepID=A0A832VXZ5_9EURY|nr:tetrahydromethanopterin S-methyltransferase subunit C [Methermicoccus shengliensis]KUK04038.1 MAG: Tetrahydromethanopterin S-methyltransferase subunit C [Euryarchaeota archaeon 55_53]KUK29714.1 MAG: Tetrahydromethanopterin S-methyltransferase subunit C [Methanosarcinales archeaon 56_1174]MDI3488053.1 tetrahydromethanopterin S-methyltransferase subunit [Methanosarcinales archaeon]MDN5295674.1 tetrahydromethanopterin S-methyltransferase subunit [Methanosarcinales archaeon]HIH70337.1 tetrahydr
MSAQAGGNGHSEIGAKQTAPLGIIGGLVCMYLVGLNDILGVDTFSFFGGFAAICAAVWGADAVARISQYGLGTGIPSIGILSVGMGIIASLFGLSVSYRTGIGFAGPLLSFATACGIGFVIGVVANRVIKMRIPTLEQATTEVGGAAALTLTGLSTLIGGSIMFDAITTRVIDNGFVGMVLIIGALAILHPFNACLGPDETRIRTLTLAVVTSSIAMFFCGLGSFATLSFTAAALSTVLGVLIWVVAFKRYFRLVKRDAYAVLGTGMLPEVEEM